MAKKVEFAITHDGGLLATMIDSIATRSKDLHTDLHTTAVSCVLHAVKHGDVMYAQRLIDTMGDGWRKNQALIPWFIKFGPFKWVAKTQDKPAHFGLDKDRRNKMAAEFDADSAPVIEAVSKVPFWSFKKETPFEGFDLAKEISKLVKRAKGIKDDPEKATNPKTKIDGKQLAALAALAVGEAATVH